jgi:aminoglycoside phosphotransferase (APT) family kinase protein
VACDPTQADAVADATLAWIRAHVPGAAEATWVGPLEPAAEGLSTYIWFGRLRASVSDERWRGPLALRVFGSPEDDDVLEREHAILGYVADHDYPVPRPIAAVPARDSGNPADLPWMVLPRIEGRPLLAVISSAPWAVPARLGELAALQARLHAIPVAGCPLAAAAGALVDRWLAARGRDIEAIVSDRARAVLGALRERAGCVRAEERVVCHGDFHPLNVLSRRDGSAWRHVVIDWTDATVGDRHFDVARTLALFRVASIAAGSRAERVALRLAGPGLVRTYRRAYERSYPLDDRRLAYWTAAHYLYGWWQIRQLHEDAFERSRASTEAVPLAVADQVLARAEAAIAAVSAA